MKIIYLCADRGISLEKFNGATAHFRSLVRAFQKLGHDLLVLTPSAAASENSIGAPFVRIYTPPHIQSLLDEVDQEVPRDQRAEQRSRKRVAHALAHICNNVGTEQTLAEQIERFKPDFVFELHSPFGAAGALTCNRLGQRHLLNVHAPLAWEGATFRSQALQQGAEYLEDAALRHARRIVTNSHEMRHLLAKAGVDCGKIGVVFNGVDLDLFSPAGETRRPPGSAIVIGFSGSLKAWHGVDALCEAFRQVSDDPRLHLLIVGDGPERKRVEALRAELPDRVTFAGAHPLEDMPAWMRGMDIAVAPYPPMENFYFSPLKILDAMACGVANVASKIGQVNELLREGETGLLTPPGDASALAAALRKLANDAPLRHRLGKAGLRDARQRHAWSSRAADIIDFAMSGPAT